MIRFTLAPALALLLAVMPALSAGPDAVILSHPPALVKGLQAMPRIMRPITAGTKAVNTALTRADQRVRKALVECKSGAQDGTSWSWERKVGVPMRGPGFLSLVTSDDTFCGGAHPNDDTVTLTYDLATGAPVDWVRLLGRAVAGKAATDTADDGTPVGTLSSAVLQAFYTKATLKDGDAATRDECTAALGDSTGFILWLDAKEGGIAIQPYGLPHAAAACATPEVMPVAMLRRMGADADMLAAIKAAHTARAYEE